MRLWLACAISIGVLAGNAAAAGRVGLVNLRFVDVPDRDREAWLAAIQKTLETRGLQVISEANLRYVQSTSAELFACFGEDRCRTEIGRRLQADLLLTGQVVHDKDEWQGNLTLHATDLGLTAKNQAIHCPGCSEATFQERLVETVNDLVNADRATARATLLVRTQPAGAAVKIDGRPVGTSELEQIVAAGARHLEVTHENHDPVDMTVETRAGERLEVDLKLPPRTPHPATTLPSVAAAPSKRAWFTMRRIVGVSMVAAGVVGLVAGIPMAALDGHRVENGVFYYGKGIGAGGAALCGIGGALVVTGGLVLLLSRNAEPPRAVLAPVVGPRSAGLAAQVTF
jgi:PEGA domain